MRMVLGRSYLAAIAFAIFVNTISIAAQTDSIYRLPVGTRIRLKMDGGINSKVSSKNDTFTAVVSKAVVVGGTVVLREGAVIEGRISGVSRASAGRNGEMDVVFETLRIKKEADRSIDGMLVNKLVAASSGTATFLTIIGGAAAGAAIGAAAKSGAGAAAGAGIGGGIGAAVALLRKGRDVGIKGSEEFEIELRKEVVLPVHEN